MPGHGCLLGCGHDGGCEFAICETCGLKIAPGISWWLVTKGDSIEYEMPCKCALPIPQFRFAGYPAPGSTEEGEAVATP